MKLDFDAVFYYVSDLDRAIDFYTRVLGFKFLSRDDVARFDIGGVLFEVVPASAENSFEGRGNARLCLKTGHIDDAVAALRALGVRTGPVEPKSNGALATFWDPDGNEICLWQYALSKA